MSWIKNFQIYLERPGGGSGTPPLSTGIEDIEEEAQDLADLEGDTPSTKTPKTPKTPEEEDEEEVRRDEEELDGREGREKGEREDGEEEETEEETEEDDEKGTEEENRDAEGVKTASYSDIKKKYPNIFKEFPQLRSALFLAPKFQEIFADPETAAEAADKVQEYDQLEESLVTRGDPELLLATLAETT